MINKLAALCASNRTDGKDGTDAFLVGGFVRDWLLFARPGRDIDIAVPGEPYAFAQQIAQKFGGTVVSLGPAHGVVRVVVADHADDARA